MRTLVLVILAVLVFFGLALYSIRIEENRREDRRQQDHPVPEERRKQSRRRKNPLAYALWVLRSLKSKFTR